MNNSNSPVIVIVGHVCIDNNTINGQGYLSWGSPAMYIANYYSQKYAIKTHIVSSYGTDFNKYIQEFTLMASPSTGSETLLYKNIVKKGHRIQYCFNEDLSQPVLVNESISKLINSADILIVAPNIPNFTSSYLESVIKEANKNCYKILLPQGLLRKIENGRVKKQSLKDYKQILKHFDVLVMSDEDINNSLIKAHFWSSLFSNLSIIVTKAERGATLFLSGKMINMPTKPIQSEDIVNPVGAGDMFSAEVAMELFKGRSIKSAIKLAHKSTAKILTSKSNFTKI